VGVRRGDDVGPRGVHGRVDHEGRAIHRALAFDDLTLVVDENQIGDSDVAEVHAEGVDPEVVQQFGVPGRDVPGHALGKAQLAKDAQCASQTLLAVLSLGLDGRKSGRNIELEFGLVFSETVHDISHALPPN
jgi:hypothetical protein